MTEQTTQAETANNHHTFLSLAFQILDQSGEETCQLPVAVKNLTTAGVVLEVAEPTACLLEDYHKGSQGFLLGSNHDDSLAVKVPAKILWTRQRDEATAATLGLELLKPLPQSMRHTLEDNLAFGSRDMRLLWDYWDELQAADDPEPPAPAPPPLVDQTGPLPADPQPAARNSSALPYWAGFGAIVTGIALQYPQSEQLAFSGLVVMFLGSLVVAGKSLTCVWQNFSSPPTELPGQTVCGSPEGQISTK